MKREEESSIFDYARKKAKPAPKPKSTPPASEAKEEEPTDMKQMFDKMRTMHRELKESLEKTFEKTGINPKHFEDSLKLAKSTPLWTEGQKEKQLLEQKVAEAIGTTVPRAKTEKERKETHMSKERKGKTLGSRKKWIPVK